MAATISTSASCHASPLTNLAAAFFTKPVDSRSQAGQPQSSFRSVTAEPVNLFHDYNDDDYSADFSPEAFTKQQVSFRRFGIHDQLIQTPLLPLTPCVPHEPLDANKGYPLPTSCFADIDWIAEYNSSSNSSAVLTPKEYSASLSSSSSTTTMSATFQAEPGSTLPSVSNSLVQCEIDGDDSMYWYKSTTRFASPDDEWDYQRLRNRIREFTKQDVTLNRNESSLANSFSSCADCCYVDDALAGLGPAANVNHQVRQRAVQRLKLVLAHLIGPCNPAADLISKQLDDYDDEDDLGLDASVDIGRIRMAIDELQREQ
ncbi:hypothetical protein V1514DRAFT_334526 [Lipomyces japonicus]|uniref:uncharacterized protein n=1 Tax=Lipomyces japonicus TaxID=56871 RepID=UPI0034CE4DD3